jgi:hypothetical protein
MSETIKYKPWAEPGAAAVTVLPKMIEHPEPGGVLDDAEVFTVVVVGVEAPPKLLAVKLFGAVDIRDGDDDYLELHVHFRGGRLGGRIVTTDFSGTHGCLLMSSRVVDNVVPRRNSYCLQVESCRNCCPH